MDENEWKPNRELNRLENNNKIKQEFKEDWVEKHQAQRDKFLELDRINTINEKKSEAVQHGKKERKELDNKLKDSWEAKRERMLLAKKAQQKEVLENKEVDDWKIKREKARLRGLELARQRREEAKAWERKRDKVRGF